jgi:hypothetical protein
LRKTLSRQRPALRRPFCLTAKHRDLAANGRWLPLKFFDWHFAIGIVKLSSNRT